MALALDQLLNEEQLRAVSTTDGPLLVLAGAGSGKTRVLVHRIAHIIEQGLARPYQILAVTFTNKAAGEMRHRLAALLGPEAGEAWIGTFHSMCGRILRRDGHRLGYERNFSIFDSDDTKRVLKKVLDDLGIDTGRQSNLSVPQVAHEIDRAKNDGLTPDAYAKLEQHAWPKIAAKRAYPRYQEALRQANAMDFGDLLLLAVQLLRHHPEVRDKYSGRFRYVLVDEFQDTNKVQYDFLKLLVEGHRNLAVVGDDDQAIYRWRGAEVSNILNFTRTFPEAEEVKLERNYRSTKNILSAANAVIRHNQRRHAKTLYTERDTGLPIGIAMVEFSDDEAWLVAEALSSRINAGERADNFAILYRLNAQSRPFEQALRRRRVPYVLIGATGFFERREVKDVLAYLRLIANPVSSPDFERIINVPGRQLGAKTLEKLSAAADSHGLVLAQVTQLDDEKLAEAGIKGQALKRLRKFGELIDELREAAKTSDASEVTRKLIERTEYLEYLERSDPKSAEDRIANVQELVSSVAEFEDRFSEEGLAGADTALAGFLEESALMTPSDQRGEDGAVSLMTLHAAKGLEFPVVFIPGMEEETFPSRRALDSEHPEELAEERRLCYVGFTRAKEELNLSCARRRLIYGQVEPRRPSRFLGDLPDQIVQSLTQPDAPVVPTKSPVIRFEDPGPSEPVVRSEDGPQFVPGSCVEHNTFGAGVVEGVRGSGPRAHLTIRFPTVGLKQVVAKFVRPAEG